MTNTMKMIAIMEVVDEINAEGYFAHVSTSIHANGDLHGTIYVLEAVEQQLDEAMIVFPIYSSDDSFIKSLRNITGVVRGVV